MPHEEDTFEDMRRTRIRTSASGWWLCSYIRTLEEGFDISCGISKDDFCVLVVRSKNNLWGPIFYPLNRKVKLWSIFTNNFEIRQEIKLRTTSHFRLCVIDNLTWSSILSSGPFYGDEGERNVMSSQSLGRLESVEPQNEKSKQNRQTRRRDSRSTLSSQ